MAHGSRRGDDQAVSEGAASGKINGGDVLGLVLLQEAGHVGHLLPGGEIGIDFLFGSDAVHSPSLYLLNMDKRVWHGRS